MIAISASRTCAAATSARTAASWAARITSIRFVNTKECGKADAPHAAGIRLINRIIPCERIGVEFIARIKDRIPAEEAADDGIVQSCAEVDDAERSQAIAAIPLLV